jgi:hypothetical protein
MYVHRVPKSFDSINQLQLAMWLHFTWNISCHMFSIGFMSGDSAGVLRQLMPELR